MLGRASLLATALLVVAACEQTAALRPSTTKTEASSGVTSPARVTNMPSVEQDCSISLPAGYIGPDPLSQEKSREPINPTVIAWDSGAWGTIDVSWRITRGGLGCFIENERRLPDDDGKPTIHKFQVSNREFDEIAATLNYGRLNAQMTNCENVMSDAENGSYDWYGQGRVSFVRFDKGDKCSGSAAFYQTMNAVTARVKANIIP